MSLLTPACDAKIGVSLGDGTTDEHNHSVKSYKLVD